METLPFRGSIITATEKTVRIHHDCESGIEKSVPRYNQLASPGLPSNDKR